MIGVMSSRLGSVAGNESGWQVYKASKATLAVMMGSFAVGHAGNG